MRSTVATYDVDAGGHGRIRGALQAVTLQRRLDRKLAAHAAVTTALDSWTSLEQEVDDLLARLAAAMELAFAAFWVPDGQTLAARAVWHPPSPALLTMADLTWLAPGSRVGQRRPRVREPDADHPLSRELG